MRRVVAAALYQDQNLVVVCDDGTVWACTLGGSTTDGTYGIYTVNQRWQKVSRVPGTEEEAA